MIHNSYLCPTYFPTSSSNKPPEMFSHYNHQFWNRRRSKRTYQAFHQRFYFVFVLTTDQISCEKCPVRGKVAIFLQSWTIDPHFLRKMPGGGKSLIAQSWTIDPHFVRRVAPAKVKSQFFLRVWRSTFILCERVPPAQVKSLFLLTFRRSSFISCERVDVSWLHTGTTRGLKTER